MATQDEIKKIFTKEKAIEEYLNNGKSLSFLSNQYGTSIETIKKILASYEISLNEKLNDNLKHENLKNVTYEQFYSLYHASNLSYAEIAQILGVSERQVQRLNSEKFKIKRDTADVVKRRKETFKEKYDGAECARQVKSIQQKIENDYCKKHGVKNPSQNTEVQNKRKETCLKKYGVENPFQSEEVKRKIKEKHKNRVNTPKFSKSNTPLAIDENLSKAQLSLYIKEIVSILKCIGIQNIILNFYDYDIYLPDYKFGIEFNGNYWHSEIFKGMNYHQDKSILANNTGIFIYHIFEYEWEDQELKQKIISQLKTKLKLNKTIYARNCGIKEISKKEKREFLNENHIQSDCPSNIEYGLIYNNEIVAVMTFSKSRFKQYDIALSRFANKSGYNIVGGASKLFKYFVSSHPNLTIVSYSDITKTSGNLYNVLGFTEKAITKPNYIWWKPHSGIKTRDQCRMKDEIQTMHDSGYYRIFDCGHKTWIFKS